MTLVGHFRHLLAYETWANRLVIASLETIPPGPQMPHLRDRVMRLLPHNQLARRIWLYRLTATPYENPQDWFPMWELDALRRQCAEIDEAWAGYLGGLDDAALARVIRYTSSEGKHFENSVHDVLTHVFNHGTYHRGQVARLVSELGGARASTDFILFARRQVG